MALNVIVTLVPPALSDTGVWFANAAAFNTFMRQIQGYASIDPADTSGSAYGPLNYDESLVPAAINIDGTDYVLITLAMFSSLKDKLIALDANYQALRTAMETAGLISNA